jgi:glycosyltransferase involved in cell wall biosynthesis
LVADGNFDLLHLNEPHALTSAWLARAHGKLPLLLSRRIGFPLRKNWVSQARYRALNKFVANSRDVAQSLINSGIAANKISIVNEGVAIPPATAPAIRAVARAHWHVSDNEFLFGCVGVFVPEKGQRHLIEALAMVRVQHPEARLLLAGDGACRADLESLAKRLAQTEAIHFAGFVNNVNEVYQALDAFLFPSEFEGLGTALQTAMAFELPSISTTRGALAEVVTGERTALISEPDGREFAAAMLRLLNDPQLQKSLGAAARHEVEQKFSAQLMVNKTIRVYEEVLRTR